MVHCMQNQGRNKENAGGPMKDDLAKALNGVLVLQQWQNQLVQSALRQLDRKRLGNCSRGKGNPSGRKSVRPK